ncbi:MAG: hypothetical protein PHR77_20265 [Kiritimatiellae bacterium]|nr:hypothetical protein [Kiritimatiellia bacterium]
MTINKIRSASTPLSRAYSYNKQCQAIFGGGKLGVVPVPNNKKCRNFTIKCGTSFRGRYANLPVSWGVIPVVIGFAEILCYGKIILRQGMIKVGYHRCDWFGDTSLQYEV